MDVTRKTLKSELLWLRYHCSYLKSNSKTGDGIIDFKENILYLRITKEDIKLEETTTGHLVVILAKNIKDDKEEIIPEFFLIKVKSGQEKRFQ